MTREAPACSRESGSTTTTPCDIRVIVYDCDGVLFDSRDANAAYYTRILARFGLPPLSEEQRDIVQMITASQAMVLLFGGRGLVEEARRFEKSLGNEESFSLMKIEPHVVETLETLRTAYGYRTAVVSNRGKSLAPLLRYYSLEHLFDKVVGSNDVSKPKPHVESIERITDHFGITPRCILYVGDSEVDLDLCTAAGVQFVAYKNRSLNCLCHMNDHLDLLKFLVSGRQKTRPGEAADG